MRKQKLEYRGTNIPRNYIFAEHSQNNQILQQALCHSKGLFFICVNTCTLIGEGRLHFLM